MLNNNVIVSTAFENSYAGNDSNANSRTTIRTNLSVDNTTEFYESNAITQDNQLNTVYFGDESLSISLSSELKTDAYTNFLAGIMGNGFYTRYPDTVTCTITSLGNSKYKITPSIGTLVNRKQHEVIYLTSGTYSDVNKHVIVCEVLNDGIIVSPLSGNTLALVTNAEITIHSAGREVYIRDEQNEFSFLVTAKDTVKTQSYIGNVVNNISIESSISSLPRITVSMTGKAAVDFDVWDDCRVWSDVIIWNDSGTAYNAPTSLLTEPMLTCYGKVLIGSSPVAVNAVSFDIARDVASIKTLNSHCAEAASAGAYKISGSITAYVTSDYFRQLYSNKQGESITIVLAESDKKDSSFIRFTFPFAVISSYSETDDSVVMCNMSFSALKGESTVFEIQEKQKYSYFWDDILVWNDNLNWGDWGHF